MFDHGPSGSDAFRAPQASRSVIPDDWDDILSPAKPQAPEAESQRLISLVLLLGEPRNLDAGAVAQAVSKAVGSEVREGCGW